MTQMLTIQLIGDPAFTLGTQPLQKLNTHYFEALLGGLLLERSRRLSRDDLGFRFWPAHDELARRRNLRQLLYRIKEIWPECTEYLEISTEFIRWKGDSPCWLDIERLEYVMNLPPSHEGLDEVWILHRGTLMAGHQERWITPRRREFILALQRYFRHAILWAEELREKELCLRCLESLVMLTPERDELWVELARGYMEQGAYDRLEEAGFRYTQAATNAGSRPSEQVLTLFRSRPLRLSVSTPAVPVAQERGVELDSLMQLRSKARQGASTFALVKGFPGMGKTWLLHALQQSVQSQHGQVLFHTCFEGLSTAPFATLAAVMRELAPGALPADWNHSSVRFVLKEGGGEEGNQELSSLAKIDRLALLRRIQAGIMSKLPLMLILDDVHRCDRASLEMFAALLLDRSDMRFMLVASVNSMFPELSNSSGFRRLLDDLLRQRGSSCEYLEPLSPAQTTALVRTLSLNRASPELIATVVERSEGIPQVIQELLWELDIVSSPVGQTVSFRKQVQQWLETVSRDARDLAMIAALVGPRFHFETLVQLTPSGMALEACLDELFALNLLKEFPDGQIGWTFAELRAAVCDGIHTYKRLRIEQRIAECQRSA